MVNSLETTCGNKILYSKNLDVLNDESRFIISYFEREINNRIPGINAKRVYKIFQRDEKLTSLTKYTQLYLMQENSINLINLLDTYVNYVWSLYMNKPEEFFRLESYFEQYMKERLKYFGFKVVSQYRVKTAKYGLCVVDIYLPELGYIIELKTSTYKKNRSQRFCEGLQREKYQEAFNTACLLLYASQIHEFERMLFIEKSLIGDLLNKF